jgi:hypothetical protein
MGTSRAKKEGNHDARAKPSVRKRIEPAGVAFLCAARGAPALSHLSISEITPIY